PRVPVLLGHGARAQPLQVPRRLEIASRGHADRALRAGRARRALPPAVPDPLEARDPREALSPAVVVCEKADESAAISTGRAARRRSRSGRQAAEKGAPARQARLGGDLAVVEAAARASLVLHAHARLGVRRTAGPTQPHLSRRIALDGRHRRASRAGRALDAESPEARR